MASSPVILAAWWKPTAEGYFRHVPKAAILEAVGQFAPEQVSRLAKLKKTEIADEADQHTPVAEAGCDCICLAATDAPLRFRGMMPRLLQPIFRI